MDPVYLDHAATTPLRPEVRKAMAPYLDEVFGNPSGQHSIARRAKNALEEARERVAAIMSVDPHEIVFTSGGTESDNLAVVGRALSGNHRGGVVVSAVEHEAVLEAAALAERLGSTVSVVEVDQDGVVDPDQVASRVGSDTKVVSVMAANNETGVVQPIPEIADAVHAASPDVVVHCDAVQWAASRPLPLQGPDLLTICGHKIGGPRGVGVLVVGEGIELAPTAVGGGQELGRRSGTPDVATAVGMATALEHATRDRDRFTEEVGGARDRFEELVTGYTGIEVTSAAKDRLIQHSHLSVAGAKNETVLIRLDGVGIAASAGSSCQSGAATPSHVLTAMGWPAEKSRTALRFTFGWNSTKDHAEKAAKALLEVV